MTKKKPTIKEKLSLLKEAINNEDYKSLTSIQFEVWKRLIRRNLGKPKAYSNVFNEVGISNKNGRKTLLQLFRKNLLVKNSKGHLTFEGVKTILKDIIGEDPIIQTIWGSLKEKKMFDALEVLAEKEGLMLYPGVLLRDFINIDKLRELYPTFYIQYFLYCNFDAVAVNKDGLPVAAFEYQGGYHRCDPKTKKRDALKRKVLELAKIPLIEINSRSLKNIKKKWSMIK